VTHVCRAITLALLLAASAACATAGLHQNGPALPSAAEIGEGGDASDLEAARAQEARGDAAGAANDQARVEWSAAAARYAELAERRAMAEWRVALRQRAAAVYLRAQRWDKASEAAQAIVADERATDGSRAVGARLAAAAAVGAARAAEKAGQLEKLDLGTDGKEKARPPHAGWQRVVEAVDAYLARAGADPERRHASSDWPPSGPHLALVAAEVQYAYGNVEDARRRLDAALERWPGDEDLVARAVPMYLATFLARGDQPGYAAAVERFQQRLSAEVAKEKDRARKEALAKQLEALSQAKAGARYGAGEELMRKGKPADAAAAFEAAAERGGPDAANALHNAAVAWDAAGEAAKAAKVRERLLEKHPGAAVTAEDALRLGAFRSRQGDHAAAAKLYDEFLRRWPSAAGRCVALRNVAAELDRAARPSEAAARYAAFGSDAACAKAEPDIAARALVRAGRLFDEQAKAAYSRAAGLEGVTDSQAKSDVAEAKRRVKEP
jgi:hypothetical protein